MANDKLGRLKHSRILKLAIWVILTALVTRVVWAVTSTYLIGNSSTTGATQSSTQRNYVRTSDGTLHSFVQAGTQTWTCNGSSKSGLLWSYSSDGGQTWTCGDQLSSDTVIQMFASAVVDSSDNIYVTYSAANSGNNLAYDVYFRKLTKGSGSSWTLGSAQTVMDANLLTSYTYSVIEVEGSNRLWLASRYFDGANYQIVVYYSNNLSDSPTWTVSKSPLDTPNSNSGYHYPSIVRFGSKIGIVYNAVLPTNVLRWRVRDDNDPLNTWSDDSVVSNQSLSNSAFTTISDNQGNVYFAQSNGSNIYFSYWNGKVWSATSTVSSSSTNGYYVSLASDGTNVWVIYADTYSLSSSLPNYFKLVYKKGVLPYSSADFDAIPSPVVSYHGVLDKFWSYVGTSYQDDTADAGSTNTADTRLVSGTGDIVYFGKSERFDSAQWALSTNGSGGAVSWEYWNGTSWAALTSLNSSNAAFTGSGWITFTDPLDWAVTKINNEANSYYYIRARATSNYSTVPVGTQLVTIPSYMRWSNFLTSPVTNKIYGMWSENSSSPVKIKSGYFNVTSSAPNTSSVSSLTPNTVGFSSTSNATQPSTQHSIVKTSDGTLHAFVQAGIQPACGGNTANGYANGLIWVYSLDNGVSWTCGGQLYSDPTYLMSASAVVDIADNIYIVYSIPTSGTSAFYDVYYRKLTKVEGSNWSLGAAQTVLDADLYKGYSYAVIEVDSLGRLWLATRYTDGATYMVNVYYSNDLSDAPNWTASQTSLSNTYADSSQYYPTILKFGGNKIGIIYLANGGLLGASFRWRYRNDADLLNVWTPEAVVNTNNSSYPSFMAVSVGSNNIYFASRGYYGIDLSYWNGNSWLVNTTQYQFNYNANSPIGLTTDGTNLWLTYFDTAGLASGYDGSYKLVYQKVTAPFSGSNFNLTPTPVVSYHGVLDKYWSYYSSSFTNDTTDSGSTGGGDTQLFSRVGDAAYFGRTMKYDSISWLLSTVGVYGQVAWEYWNGSVWAELSKFTGISNSSFWGSGYISFIPPNDWATTNINSEATPYYYVRARTIVAYTTTPVATQISTIPRISWAGNLPTPINNNVYSMWTENSTNPTRLRFGSFPVTATTPNSASTSEIDPKVIAYSGTTNVGNANTQRQIIKTSDGTIHTFVQGGNRKVCGESTSQNNVWGLVWVYSTDSGQSWVCGGQITSDMTMYPSVASDGSSNIYMVYSTLADGSNTTYSTYYRKLTKGSGTTWTVGDQQRVLDASSGLVAYTFSVIEVDSQGRLWLASRYYDGTNYQVSVYYSDDSSNTPIWKVSQASLNTPNGGTGDNHPAIVSFGGKIGVIYETGVPVASQRWRWRSDSEAVASWSAEQLVSTVDVGSAQFTVESDDKGYVYHVSNSGQNVRFNYWNGVVWSPVTALAGLSSAGVGLSTDGNSVWVIYGDMTNLTGAGGGSRRLSYRKGVAPYTSSEFDLATPLYSYQNVFDKYWSYYGGNFTNDSVDAGNVINADTQMVSQVGDIAYFGKLEKFDAVSWDLSTSGVSGNVVWEYWNGSVWDTVPDYGGSGISTFTNDSYITFIPPNDWSTTIVNSESTPYYYVRARVTAAYTTTPVGVQMHDFVSPAYMKFLPSPVSGNVVGFFGENTSAPVRIRYGSFSVSSDTPNNQGADNLSLGILSSNLYSSDSNSTGPSTERHLVRTSDGTLHAFIQAWDVAPCANSNSQNNSVGLIWVYSADSGQTWNCGAQINNDRYNIYYVSAVKDSSDNIYIVYSVNSSGGSQSFDVLYRKFTKGTGSTWTMSNAQVALDSSLLTGYSYASLALDDSHIWIATRYFDSNNYQVLTAYSSDQSASPTWTVSQTSMNTLGTSTSYHYPSIVRFGNNVGVIYNSQSPTDIRWRYRTDGDSLSSWNGESQILNLSMSSPAFSAVGDVTGKIYLAVNRGNSILFTYWNGSGWTSPTTVSSSAYSYGFTNISLVGSDVYIYYGDITGLSGNLFGSRKLVYKKGVYPYSAANFDNNPTQLISYHGFFDKYWSYSGGVFINDTIDISDVDNSNTIGSGTVNDTQMLSSVDDTIYFGKQTKYDAISWYLNTNGVNGIVVWEYWNGTSWAKINKFLGVANPSFTSTGYVTFIPPNDWSTTIVNSEATPYYYIRARTVKNYTTAPAGIQATTVSWINWVSTVDSASNLYSMWTENNVSPVRVRFSGYEFNLAPNQPINLGPSILASGGATSSSTPTLQFTTSDTNVGETATYRLQIDDTKDFSSPIVDYISALQPVGMQSFTVGSDPNGGNYYTGSSGQNLADGDYYWRVMSTDLGGLTSTYSTANLGEIAFSVDTTRPTSNADSLVMLRSAGGNPLLIDEWTNDPAPYFSWSAASDNINGSGIKGYCLYLGQDVDGDPATSKGLLGTSLVDTSGSTCQFITPNTSIDFASLSYRGDDWLSTSTSPYYLNIKAVDNTGNLYLSDSLSTSFRFEDTRPINVGFISPASGSFNSVADMSFGWPTSGSSVSNDNHSGVLGWQYQINSTSGSWLGNTIDVNSGQSYIPINESSYYLTVLQDESSIISGNNTIYFRTIDIAGNVSDNSTIRAGNILFGGQAPTFAATDVVTVSPSSANKNEFSLSWPHASTTSSPVTHYYYMINTPPPATLETLQGNTSTYLDNSLNTSVNLGSLSNVNKGSNTVYVVAVDEDGHYSPTNYITGSFILNSTNPDNVLDLVTSDSSIKSTSKWNVALSWTEPTYQGAGNLTYLIYRSKDGLAFTHVGSATGLAYVDNVPESSNYYYKVYTKDGANALSSGTNAVTITPTGKWTTSPSLDSGPTVTEITTKKSTVSWTTSRGSDSKVQYGTEPGKYDTVEPSNSTQVSAHTIKLSGLNPGTTYYYRAKWTDEDGNTGSSDEKSFSTSPAPSSKGVAVKSVGLTSAMIQFTSLGASKVKIYYGQSTSFGGTKEIATSTDESTYNLELSGLMDGTKYYYQINAFDSDGSEYLGTILDFTTLPKPKISKVRVQQVVGTAQSTLLISWDSNTEISSIVSYYPVGRPADIKDEVSVALLKGEHKMILRGLLPMTDYSILVKGKDRAGNEAVSDIQKVTTAMDTRAPQIEGLRVEGSNTPSLSQTDDQQNSQLVVSWNTDEPATSQVEFGEGTGDVYNQKTQEDANLTTNHLVIISNLTPSKVYHLRAISSDKAGNQGRSIDTVTITPKANDNALNLVITNLQQVFGFIKGL